jgi:hypothetical protein
MNMYVVKTLTGVQSNVLLAQPDRLTNPPVTMESPAESLLSDLTKIQAVSVLATTQIDAALQQMIAVGVRLLFVTDADFRLIGLITSYDIAGEKPLLYLQSRDGRIDSNARASIHVQHIMQPLSNWRVLSYSIVQRAKVGDIVETFKHAGQRYLMVLQEEHAVDDSVPLLRGLFSARQFERALGITLDSEYRSNNFAELERALNHPLASPLLESNPWRILPRAGQKWV